MSKIIEPHGGKLINCFCRADEVNKYKSEAVNYKSWTLTDRHDQMGQNGQCL